MTSNALGDKPVPGTQDAHEANHPLTDNSADATGQQPTSGTRAMRSAANRTETQLLVAVAGLSIFFAAKFGDVFLGTDNLINMGRVGAILLVVAIGQMFALVVGGFDISVGANMGFTSVVVGLQLTNGAPAYQAVAVGLAVGTGVGIVNGFMVAFLNITPFVATLGMLTFLTGFANQQSQGASVSGLPDSIKPYGGTDWAQLPSAVGIAVIVLVVSWAVIARSRVGLYIFAIGGSRETARLSGVPVRRYEVMAYAACGLLAGVAGVMLTARIGVGQSSLGLGYELSSVATAVIGGVAIGGGIGKLRGVVLGVALIAVLTTGLDLGAVNQFVQQMVMGAVLVVSVVVSQHRGRKWTNPLTRKVPSKNQTTTTTTPSPSRATTTATANPGTANTTKEH